MNNLNAKGFKELSCDELKEIQGGGTWFGNFFRWVKKQTSNDDVELGLTTITLSLLYLL